MSRKRCLTNIRDVHTCSISGVYLIMAMVGFPSSKLVHLVSQVISCPCVQVRESINRRGERISLSGKAMSV
jgi:hypothetical protein